jgi:hypothetical protein
MTTQERNKEIATMLGHKGMQSIVSENGHHYPSDEELEFDSDWNWLMEAVEFIEKNHAYVNIRGCYVNITLEHSVSSSTKKEATFTAVYDFAKLFNEKKL